MSTLYVGNDNDVVITGLSRESDGSYIADATLTAQVMQNGSNLGSPISLTYSSAGNYRGTIPAGSPTFVANTAYQIVISASNYGFSDTLTLYATVRGT